MPETKDPKVATGHHLPLSGARLQKQSAVNRLVKIMLGLLAFALNLAAMPASTTAQIQIFSTGEYGTPETISLAPSEFGAFGGSYFIPDASTSNIWVLPVNGGSPTTFLAAPIEPVGDNIICGMFLPSGWGSYSGEFLVASTPSVLVFDSDGNQEFFDPTRQGLFTTPLIAPAEFAPYDGHLFITDQNNRVWRVDPAGGGLTPFKDFPAGSSLAISPFGIEFTPPDWGAAFGNRMLVSDASPSVNNGPGTKASYVVAVSADGTSSLFATVPLKEGRDGVMGQDGLRQMLMTPDDYFLDSLGISGKLLLLSVTGSRNGGGILGELLALDSSGTVAAHLQVGSILAKFDPRGMIFTSDGGLLISDTSDPILLASARDFIPGRDDPLAVKQDVLDQLIALRAAITDRPDGVRLDQATDHLSKSTDSSLWIDPARPQPSGGAKVFNEEKDAVIKLDDLLGDKHSTVPDAVLQSFIDRLVQADRVLAFVAITDALAAHADAKKIAQARQELANGDSEAVSGRSESAIEHYRNAWNQALKA
jgi:hypothetical protein